ncbi:MAG: TerC family protein [Deltaproteobacteria bacterium]|nr:TerC family protein [Deltaproteobacteria bacterium]
MEAIFSPDIFFAFLTLTVLEIVLGIDNIIFIAILASRLPEEKRAKARTVGLALAMVTRIGLLFSLSLIMKLTAPFFSVLGMDISGRDIILLAGGLFLLAKSTVEIHKNVEGDPHHIPGSSTLPKVSFSGVVTQIMILDIVFSLDSVITAVGLSNKIFVMAGAIITAVIVMMFLSGPLANFVESHPTIKILALAFLLLIGTALMAEGLEFHISKGYLYFAMAFSTFVEMLNIRMRKKTRAVQKK